MWAFDYKGPRSATRAMPSKKQRARRLRDKMQALLRESERAAKEVETDVEQEYVIVQRDGLTPSHPSCIR